MSAVDGEGEAALRGWPRRALAYADYRAQRIFPGLDALRGLSIAGVVWHHAGVPVDGVLLSTRGFVGVDAFFVLSGFLIVTLLLRERDRHGQISLRDFYLRRSLRIFPLYYGVVLGLALLLWLRPGFTLAGSFWSDLPWLLTYTANWVGITGLLSVTWSLAAEEQFYLLWPPVERFLGRAVLLVWIGAVAVNQAANFGLLDGLLPPGHRHEDLEILQTTFTPILLGVGLAHGLHHRASYERWVPWLTHAGVRVGLVVVLVGVLGLAPELSGGPRLLVHVALVGLLASWVTGAGPRPRLRILSRLGKVSYGVYLLHLFVMHVLEQYLLPHAPVRVPGDRFVACLLGTWLVAEASFALYERPFLRLKGRFARS